MRRDDGSRGEGGGTRAGRQAVVPVARPVAAGGGCAGQSARAASARPPPLSGGGATRRHGPRRRRLETRPGHPRGGAALRIGLYLSGDLAAERFRWWWRPPPARRPAIVARCGLQKTPPRSGATASRLPKIVVNSGPFARSSRHLRSITESLSRVPCISWTTRLTHAWTLAPVCGERWDSGGATGLTSRQGAPRSSDRFGHLPPHQ